MQQTCPWSQGPLGRPPNKEQTDPEVQIPASPAFEVQVSKLPSGLLKLGFTEIGILLARVTNGLHVLAGVYLLLNRPVLTRLAPKPAKANRPLFSLSSWSVLVKFLDFFYRSLKFLLRFQFREMFSRRKSRVSPRLKYFLNGLLLDCSLLNNVRPS